MISYCVLRIAYCGAGSTAGIPGLGNTQYAVRNIEEDLH